LVVLSVPFLSFDLFGYRAPSSREFQKRRLDDRILRAASLLLVQLGLFSVFIGDGHGPSRSLNPGFEDQTIRLQTCSLDPSYSRGAWAGEHASKPLIVSLKSPGNIAKGLG
jgi:hypothetical protein